MPVKTTDRLTAKAIAALCKRPGTARSDGGGLTLTVSPGGYAAWVLRYRFGGKAKELTIGPVSEWSLEKARGERRRLRELLEAGRDPARVQAAALAATELPAAGTFTEVAEAWLVTQRRRLVHPEVPERALKNWINPSLGKLAPEDIRPAHVVACVERIIAAGAPTTANDCRRIIRQVLDYAVVQGVIEVNPAASIRASHAGVDEAARTRALSLAEIRKLLMAMEAKRAAFGRDNEVAVLQLLLLGVRKGELIGARWPELDLDRGLWTIPGSRIKTRRKGKPMDFVVPLPPQAVALFRELEVRAAGSEWVLPARRQGRRKRGHISPDTLNFALDNLEHGLDDFVVHDLRRTMRSQLSALGVGFAVAERCLNHKLPGQGEIYDRHDFLDQRRHALTSWAGILDTLRKDGVQAARTAITTANVVGLRKAS